MEIVVSAAVCLAVLTTILCWNLFAPVAPSSIRWLVLGSQPSDQPIVVIPSDPLPQEPSPETSLLDFVAISEQTESIRHLKNSNYIQAGNTLIDIHTKQKIVLSVLPPLETNFDKYTFKQDGLLGLRDIFGLTLLAAEFVTIDWVADTVVATTDTDYHIFGGDYSNPLVVPIASYSAIDIVSADYLRIDNHTLTDLNLNPIVIDGLTAHDYALGQFLVLRREGAFELIGFASDERVTIQPRFVLASPFVCDYSFGFVFQSSVLKGQIIDRSGEVVLEFDADQAVDYIDNDYVAFRKNGVLSVVDLSTKQTHSTPYNVLRQITGGVAIFESSQGIVLWDIEQGKAVASLADIVMFGEYVAMQSLDGLWIILDSDQNAIATALDFVSVSGEALIVGVGGVMQAFDWTSTAG